MASTGSPSAAFRGCFGAGEHQVRGVHEALHHRLADPESVLDHQLQLAVVDDDHREVRCLVASTQEPCTGRGLLGAAQEVLGASPLEHPEGQVGPVVQQQVRVDGRDVIHAGRVPAWGPWDVIRSEPSMPRFA
jgi:hypothetical protein